MSSVSLSSQWVEANKDCRTRPLEPSEVLLYELREQVVLSATLGFGVKASEESVIARLRTAWREVAVQCPHAFSKVITREGSLWFVTSPVQEQKDYDTVQDVSLVDEAFILEAKSDGDRYHDSDGNLKPLTLPSTMQLHYNKMTSKVTLTCPHYLSDSIGVLKVLDMIFRRFTQQRLDEVLPTVRESLPWALETVLNIPDHVSSMAENYATEKLDEYTRTLKESVTIAPHAPHAAQNGSAAAPAAVKRLGIERLDFNAEDTHCIIEKSNGFTLMSLILASIVEATRGQTDSPGSPGSPGSHGTAPVFSSLARVNLRGTAQRRCDEPLLGNYEAVLPMNVTVSTRIRKTIARILDYFANEQAILKNNKYNGTGRARECYRAITENLISWLKEQRYNTSINAAPLFRILDGEAYLEPRYNDGELVIKDLEYEVAVSNLLPRQVSVFACNFNGQLHISTNYDAGYYTSEQMQVFLRDIKDSIFKALEF
ncbi:hypothetical protein TRVA0_006S00606 [Trichomonascus vanleenenianus]|uniref:uncharacterized protein n=1 Tax=Trichomonascus vanleenenianus TaxID=2268995 RepID=UPI003ECB3B89